jgi:hypothetical protein
MLEFQHPIPVVVEGDKDGYAIYVTNSGTFENDVWCVALCNGGHVRHYTSDQVKIHANATFEIKKSNMKDAIVEKVTERYKQRSEVGIKKYGTTLEDNNSDNYFKHLMEELMDATLYLEKILDIVKNEPNDIVLGEKIRNMVRGKV